ncbi:IclR family transcriptional regulator [Naasia lichenicola]|uniref:IclR family transcriptional regulator n=1 Tax=Naasia lichenicola TaxID=2565933 RepID=UPI0018EEBB23|nr:IclR family transcriptional regulator [Naasia lichenicola]
MTDEGRGDVRSVASKIFAIADAFDRPGADALSLTTIAQRAQLPVPTAHRLVGEWVRWGGLTRGDDGLYRVGLRFWMLGVRAPSPRRLRAVALPHLEDLYELTRENVHMAVLDQQSALYIERLSGHAAVPIVSEVGSRLPLHATGVGLVLLAHGGDELFASVLAAQPVKYLPGTMTDEGALRRRLAEIRATGHARSVNEMTEDSFSVAAPVRDHTGEVVAAISIVAHARSSSDARLPLAVQIAGRAISRALGMRAPRD